MLHPDWLVSTINVPGGNAIILGSEKLALMNIEDSASGSRYSSYGEKYRAHCDAFNSRSGKKY